jgi:hypothetical protein
MFNFTEQKNDPGGCANTRQGLFDCSVIVHAETDNALICANTLAESKRHTMLERKKSKKPTLNAGMNIHSARLMKKRSSKRTEVTYSIYTKERKKFSK